MSKQKDFDCVQMKWEIQRKLREQYAGLPEEQARRLQWETVLADPFLGPFVARIVAKEKAPAS